MSKRQFDQGGDGGLWIVLALMALASLFIR